MSAPSTTPDLVSRFRVSDVNVIGLLGVDENRGRQCLLHITQGRPLPQQLVIVPGKAAKLCMNQILIKRSRIETDQVADAPDCNRGLEALRMHNDLVHHDTTIAPDGESQTSAVDPPLPAH